MTTRTRRSPSLSLRALLYLAPIVGIGLILLIAAGGSGGSSTSSSDTPGAVPDLTAGGAGRPPDLFAPLRAVAASQPLEQPDWAALADALAHLKTLDGAGIDPETGQLLLTGEHTDEPGPFRLEDVAVTLRAAFREPEPVGMTIDENPDDKKGPLMFVKFFAGTRDTHLGQVMFECDRLMKSLGQGVDNITKQPLTSGIPGILTQAEYSERLESGGGQARWSRFWINLSTGRAERTSGEGKPQIEESDDKSFIWFTSHRMYVDTEEMLDPGKGARLQSTRGRQSPSAKAFADALTEHYDELAQRFPVFGELKELSKLVILAEWIREKHAATIDPELVLARFDSSVRTPETTPTLATTKQSERYEIRTFGGVRLAPETQFVKTAQRPANALADVSTAHRAELRRGNAVPWVNAAGVRQQMVAVGPPIRGPTGQWRRRSLRRGESSGDVSATAFSEAQSAEAVAGVFGGRVEPAVWANPVTGAESLDLPVLHRLANPRETRVKSFTEPGGPTAEVEVPDSLQVASPSRSISISFEAEPRYDVVAHEAYFASKSSDAIRFYAGRGELRTGDGSAFRFDADGSLTGVSLPQGATFRFEHGAPPPRGPGASSNGPNGPRGPPLAPRESTGDVLPTSPIGVDTLSLPEVYIQDVVTGRGVRFQGDGRGHYFFELD